MIRDAQVDQSNELVDSVNVALTRKEVSRLRVAYMC